LRRGQKTSRQTPYRKHYVRILARLLLATGDFARLARRQIVSMAIQGIDLRRIRGAPCRSTFEEVIAFLQKTQFLWFVEAFSGGKSMPARSEHDREDRSSESSIHSLPAPLQLPVLPAHWWRTRKPRSLGRHHVKAIRAALLGIRIPGESDWLRAVTGDQATAIGIAVRQLQAYGMTSPIVDAALSAVLCCAIEGDSAARAVVESALRRRRKIDPLCAELIMSWRAARF
jgi:hypothetical protein